jgi:4-amino-4-deoxy-L-arabinose transferase-like glycosyltransferase
MLDGVMRQVDTAHDVGEGGQWVPAGWRFDVAILVAIGALLRIALALFYQPVTYPDTGMYLDLAMRIQKLALLDYGGERTPGYPLLLLAAGRNLHVVWLAQSFLGLATSVLSYWIVGVTTRDRRAALCAGAINSLCLNQIFFEANILAETLATFCVVLSVALFVVAARLRSVPLAGLLGLVVALATLTRPLYLVLAPVYVLILLLAVDRSVTVRCVAAFAVTFVVPVIVWASVNRAATGEFALTTLAGYSLSNHAGGFIELAPDRYAAIRDIYLEHRPERRATSPSKTHANTAIGAKSELLAKTGLSPVDLSRELAKMSVGLFVAHPFLYAKSVAEAWVSFWAVPIYWDPDAIRSPGFRAGLETLWQIEQKLLRAGNLLFVVLGLSWAALLALRWRRPSGAELVGLALLGVVLSSSVFQAGVEFGDNPRFGIPTQPLVVCFLALVASTAAPSVARQRRRPA